MSVLRWSSRRRAGLPARHAGLRVTRRIRPLSGGKWRTVAIYAITSLTADQATPAQLASWIRGHWHIEALHHIRDVTYGEDVSQTRAGNGPQVMATLRILAMGALKLAGHASIAAACRHHSRDATRTLATLGLLSAIPGEYVASLGTSMARPDPGTRERQFRELLESAPARPLPGHARAAMSVAGRRPGECRVGDGRARTSAGAQGRQHYLDDMSRQR